MKNTPIKFYVLRATLAIVSLISIIMTYNLIKEVGNASSITKSLVNIQTGKPIEDKYERSKVRSQILEQNIKNDEQFYVTFLDIVNNYDIVELPDNTAFNDKKQGIVKPIATVKDTLEKNESCIIFEKATNDNQYLEGNIGIEENQNQYLILNESDWLQLKEQGIAIQKDKIYAKVYKNSEIEYRTYSRKDIKPNASNDISTALNNHINKLPNYKIVNNKIVKH